MWGRSDPTQNDVTRLDFRDVVADHAVAVALQDQDQLIFGMGVPGALEAIGPDGLQDKTFFGDAGAKSLVERLHRTWQTRRRTGVGCVASDGMEKVGLQNGKGASDCAAFAPWIVARANLAKRRIAIKFGRQTGRLASAIAAGCHAAN